MGFGSYDESEQESRSVDTDADGVAVDNTDHEGELTFESDASTDDLVARLGEMRDEDDT
jgi:hypothetical protein